jgi:hypothetical protein
MASRPELMALVLLGVVLHCRHGEDRNSPRGARIHRGMVLADLAEPSDSAVLLPELSEPSRTEPDQAG